MLKVQLFHANALDKHSKLHDQLNVFVSKLDDDAIVSVNATEVGPATSGDFYSYTVMIVYKEKNSE